MKTKRTMDLFWLFPLLTVITSAEEQPAVFLRDDFAGNIEGSAISTSRNECEVVDDKKNGARDEASLVGKVSNASFGANLQESGVKTIRVMARLRIDDSAVSLVQGERFEVRLVCSADSGEKYFYFFNIYQSSLEMVLNKEMEDRKHRDLEGAVQSKGYAQARDQRYHLYTLELDAEKTARACCDGDLIMGKNFGDLDFTVKRTHHDLDFTIKRVEFVFVTPKGEGGNKWYLDEIEVVPLQTASPKSR